MMCGVNFLVSIDVVGTTRSRCQQKSQRSLSGDIAGRVVTARVVRPPCALRSAVASYLSCDTDRCDRFASCDQSA